MRERFNHSVFGAAFYTSAVLHLMRGGADAEMFWTGTEDRGGYGMMNKHGDPWPVFHAKRLCAQYVRHGDWISFPTLASEQPAVDLVLARGDDHRQSALIVHLQERPATYRLSDLVAHLPEYHRLLKIDQETAGVVEVPFDGRVTFDGYGVAVATNVESGA